MTQVDDIDLMGEYMMMGLRLVKAGVSKSDFYQMFCQQLDDVYGEVIQRHIKYGLLEWSGESIRLTKSGYLLGNQVFKDFLPG
jgi:oxygen-independent coproporphyrinogen-3 oxidase